MDSNVRDGTGLDCYDVIGGKKKKTGRDGKTMKILVHWMGRDETVGDKFLDGTGRYSSTITFLFWAITKNGYTWSVRSKKRVQPGIK